MTETTDTPPEPTTEPSAEHPPQRLLNPPFQYLGGLGAIAQAALESLFPDRPGELFSELPFGERCLLAQAGVQAVNAGLLEQARAQSLQERAFGPSTSEVSDLAQALQGQLDAERVRVGECLLRMVQVLQVLPDGAREETASWIRSHPRFFDLHETVRASLERTGTTS